MTQGKAQGQGGAVGRPTNETPTTSAREANERAAEFARRAAAAGHAAYLVPQVAPTGDVVVACTCAHPTGWRFLPTLHAWRVWRQHAAAALGEARS